MRRIHWHRRHKLMVEIHPDWANYVLRDDVAWQVMEGFLCKGKRVYSCRVVRRGPREFMLIEVSREARVKAALAFAKLAA